MKQTIKKKASQANGRSRACKKCTYALHGLNIEVCKVCRKAFLEGYMKGYHKMEMEEKIGDALLIFHQKAVEAFRDTIRLVSIRDERTYTELEKIFTDKLIR